MPPLPYYDGPRDEGIESSPCLGLFEQQHSTYTKTNSTKAEMFMQYSLVTAGSCSLVGTRVRVYSVPAGSAARSYHGVVPSFVCFACLDFGALERICDLGAVHGAVVSFLEVVTGHVRTVQ